MSRTYVDNAYNRRVGRVGMPVGSMVISRDGTFLGQQTYVDNAHNRSLGRVGLFRGSAPEYDLDTTLYYPLAPASSFSKDAEGAQTHIKTNISTSSTLPTRSSSPQLSSARNSLTTKSSDIHTTSTRSRTVDTMQSSASRNSYGLFIQELDNYANIYADNVSRGRLHGLGWSRSRSTRSRLPAGERGAASGTNPPDQRDTIDSADDATRQTAETEHEGTAVQDNTADNTGNGNEDSNPNNLGESSEPTKIDLFMSTIATQMIHLESKLERMVERDFVQEIVNTLKSDTKRHMETETDKITTVMKATARYNERQVSKLKDELSQQAANNVEKILRRLEGVAKENFIKEQLAKLKADISQETKRDVEKMKQYIDKMNIEKIIEEQIGLLKNDLDKRLETEMNTITQRIGNVVKEDFIARQFRKLKVEMVQEIDTEMANLTENMELLATQDYIQDQMSSLQKRTGEQLRRGSNKIVSEVTEMKDVIGDLKDTVAILQDEVALLKTLLKDRARP